MERIEDRLEAGERVGIKVKMGIMEGFGDEKIIGVGWLR